MYRIIIVDDEIWVANGLADIIDWESKGFLIAGVFSDPREAMAFISREKPDAVFVDIRMYAMSGIEMIAYLQKEGIESEFIIISAYQEFAYAQKAIDLNVFAYIVKPFIAGEIIECVEKLASRLMKRSAASPVFPIWDDAYYRSESVMRFVQAEIKTPFYRVVIPVIDREGAEDKSVVYINVEGGVEAFIALIAGKDNADESSYSNMRDAVAGASRIHSNKANLHHAIMEAYYSRNCGFVYADDDTVGKVQFYLCDNMPSQLSISQIAGHFNFSNAYLCTLFRRRTGFTIVRFRHLIRVRYALHLIRTTEGKLMDIAESVGFDNYNYFGKVFKKLTGGSTPEMYRRRHIE
jgi:two-component system response regulator YesN